MKDDHKMTFLPKRKLRIRKIKLKNATYRQTMIFNSTTLSEAEKAILLNSSIIT